MVRESVSRGKNKLAIRSYFAVLISSVLLLPSVAEFFALCPREFWQFVRRQERRVGWRELTEFQRAHRLSSFLESLLDIPPAFRMTPLALLRAVPKVD